MYGCMYVCAVSGGAGRQHAMSGFLEKVDAWRAMRKRAASSDLLSNRALKKCFCTPLAPRGIYIAVFEEPQLPGIVDLVVDQVVHLSLVDERLQRRVGTHHHRLHAQLEPVDGAPHAQRRREHPTVVAYACGCIYIGFTCIIFRNGFTCIVRMLAGGGRELPIGRNLSVTIITLSVGTSGGE